MNISIDLFASKPIMMTAPIPLTYFKDVVNVLQVFLVKLSAEFWYLTYLKHSSGRQRSQNFKINERFVNFSIDLFPSKPIMMTAQIPMTYFNDVVNVLHLSLVKLSAEFWNLTYLKHSSGRQRFRNFQQRYGNIL